MLPGWDSLEVTSSYAKMFTYAGFAALFFLGIFEILGHVYSVHETTLASEASARDADNRRVDAEARIAEASALAEVAKRNAADANAMAEAAKAESARANLLTAELMERASSAELKLAELNKRQEPRTIGAGDNQKIRTLFRFLGERNLSYFFEPGDEEASRLAHALQIRVGMTSSSLPFPIPANKFRESLRFPMYREAATSAPFFRIGSNEPTGIALISRDGDADPVVQLFMAVLDSFGLAANIGDKDSRMDPRDLWVVVGPKP